MKRPIAAAQEGSGASQGRLSFWQLQDDAHFPGPFLRRHSVREAKRSPEKSIHQKSKHRMVKLLKAESKRRTICWVYRSSFNDSLRTRRAVCGVERLEQLP